MEIQRKPNQSQQKVIDNFDDNILLLAAAGTGKTFTIAQKINKALNQGYCLPSQILCLTFTVKAAEEMRNDIKKYVADAEGVTIKTIHGFAYWFLTQQRFDLDGFSCQPIVCDPTDKKLLAERAMAETVVRARLKQVLKRYGKNTEWLFSRRRVYIPVPSDFSQTLQGLYWVLDQNQDTTVLLSEYAQVVEIRNGVVYYEGEKTPLEHDLSSVHKFVCPNCSTQIATQQCDYCGYDLRRHVNSSVKFSVDAEFFTHTIKEYRELYNIYTESAENDFLQTYYKIKQDDNELFRKLHEVKGGGTDNEIMEIMAECAGEFVKRYNMLLIKNNRMDFDDLIIYTHKLLRDPIIRQEWVNKYKLVFVDEAQDISRIEFSLLSTIFSNSRITVCGDIYQAIYEWRGSSPFLTFKGLTEDFGAKVCMLDCNYRSSRVLTEAAHHVIKQMYPNEYEKYSPTIVSGGADGGKIIIKCCENQAEYIYQSLLQHQGDSCIICRSNYSIKKLYQQLTAVSETAQKKLSFFTLEDSLAFYKSPPVKDFLCFVNIMLNSDDSISVEHIAQGYVHGLGKTALENIRAATGKGVAAADFLRQSTHKYGDPYGSLIEAYNNNNIVVYDLETTGLDCCVDQPVQIAAVKFGKDGICGQLNRFVIPTVEISEQAQKVHNIDINQLNRFGVSMAEGLNDFAEFSNGAALVGYNNFNFDSKILRHNANKNNVPLNSGDEFDTMSISKRFLSDSTDFKLKTICKVFGVENINEHDALSDVKATAEVLDSLINRYVLKFVDQRVEIVKKYVAKFKGFFETYNGLKEVFDSGDIDGFIKKVCNGRLDKKYPDITNQLAEFFKGGKSVDAYEFWQGRLSEATLSSSEVSILYQKQNKIPILTVHQTKGCEFDTVYIANAEEGNFPSFAATSRQSMAEEQRVFYVAITRAKSNLIITYNSQDGNRKCKPSRFLQLFPSHLVTRE